MFIIFVVPNKHLCHSKKVLSEAISKKRSPKTASRDISTRIGKEVNHVQNPGGNDELPSLGYLDKKQSSADDASEDSRGRSLGSVCCRYSLGLGIQEAK